MLLSEQNIFSRSDYYFTILFDSEQHNYVSPHYWGNSTIGNKMQGVDSYYYELNKHKMLYPRTVAEKIIDMISDDKKYGNGVSVDLPN